jgi:hypothetical protein
VTLSMRFDSSGVRNSPLARFSWAKAATAWADETGPLVRDALKDKAPIGRGPRAGRLKSAIRYSRQTGPGSVALRFEAHVPYVHYVLDGTRPHTITPKAARALRFQFYGHAPGAVVFAKRVKHPGTRANRFNHRAVLPLVPELQRKFRAAIEAAMEGL